MNPETLLAILGSLAIGGLAAEFLLRLNHPMANALSLNLTLVAGSGVLMAMGGLELAGRYGYTLILAMIAFTLIFLFSPLIFFPLRRLVAVIKFATPIDFLTFRYRGSAVARIACVCLIGASLPLFLAQFSALQAVLQFNLNEHLQLPVLVAIIAAIALINSRAIRADTARYLSRLMSASTFLLLVAMGVTVWLCIDNVFGGIEAMNDWVESTGQTEKMRIGNPAYSIISMFLIASIALPLNFNLLISNQISDRLSSSTAYVYPLLILLLCVPVLPLLWAGSILQPSLPPQDYLYVLPALLEYKVVSGLGSASILLLSVSLIASLSIMLSRMILNSFVLPNKALHRQPKLDDWIAHRTTITSIMLVVMALLVDTRATGLGITDYYLIGFAGLAQLTPGMLAALYLPTVNRDGFLIGLCAGISVWFGTLVVPMFSGPWEALEAYTGIAMGMENWHIWSIEALLVNVLLCTFFSAFRNMDAEQTYYARLCMADNIYVPARVRLDQVSVNEVKLSLKRALGDNAVPEVNNALAILKLELDERRPAALRQLRDQLSASLNLRFGVLAANRIMQQTLPLRLSAEKEPDDIYLIESMLAIHGNRLTGLASELNKLRVHHREILDNLPIGLISLAPSGEILKWNSAIANYTQITAEFATGSSIADLAQPWQAFIGDFVSADVPSHDGVRLLVDNQTRWFNIQRSIAHNQSESNADQVLLIEEQTQSVMLMQSYMDNERLASVGRLAAGVAHEIGNPLTGIACIAQNLRFEREQTKVETASLQILSQTDRIDRIVKSLINFSRGDKSKRKAYQHVNLKQVIEEAIELTSLGDEERRVDFFCAIDPELGIKSDPQQLIQMLLNLFSNALDASPDYARVYITGELLGDIIEITVSDRGIGIGKEIRDRVFEPFVTTKEPGQGTGLGLWVVFNLVSDLGGSVSLTSPARGSDLGSTAIMRLPCKPLDHTAEYDVETRQQETL